MCTSGKMPALLSKMERFQLLFLNVESKQQFLSNEYDKGRNKDEICTLNFPIDSAETSMGTSEQTHALL